MGSFADATAELERLKGVLGVMAIRNAKTESENSGAGDNTIFVKDSRIPSKAGTEPSPGSNPFHANQATTIDEVAGQTLGTEYDAVKTTVVGRWIEYEVGSEVTFYDSVQIFGN